MPVIVKFDPAVNSPQAQIIEDATSRNAGVMSAAQAATLESLGSEVTVLQPLDGTLSAPNLTNITTNGGATVLVTVPAGKTKLKVRNGGPLLSANAPGPFANLVAGYLSVLDADSTAILVPNSDGSYTVTPGQHLGIIARVSNVYSSSPETAPANEWSVLIGYTFLAS